MENDEVIFSLGLNVACGLLRREKERSNVRPLGKRMTQRLIR